jgi:hypothetical protein
MSVFGGQLLIASPYLADRNFFRSVVLIISHDREHAFGLLLNRPGHDPLSRVWEEMTGDLYERKEMVRTGGPLLSTQIQKLCQAFIFRPCENPWRPSLRHPLHRSFRLWGIPVGAQVNWKWKWKLAVG